MAIITLTKADETVNNSFEGFNKFSLSPRGKKLLNEWRKIDCLCRNSEVISYIIRRRNTEGLPVEFEIIYKLRSIIGIENPVEDSISIRDKTGNRISRNPIYGNHHKLSIVLPNNYPSAYGGNPEFRMVTETWHPNIRSSGKFKGRICLNNKDLGVAIGLDERIVRVGKYLQYQIYWANDSYPWPEDQIVAEWVREEAEPAGWVNAKEGIYVDYTKLFNSDSNEMKFKSQEPVVSIIKEKLKEKKVIIIKKIK